MKARLTSLIAAICVLLSASLLFTSCSTDQPTEPLGNYSSTNLSKDYPTPGPVAQGTQLSPDSQDALENFSVELFKQSYQEGNLFMSPISVLYALAMAGNGASGETLAQMEQVFGADIGVISASLRDYMGMVNSKDNGELSIANSMWIREEFPVSPDFLDKNSSYFGADIFSTPMDITTVRDVNLWANDKTNGMIPKVLNEDDFDVDTRLILVNALRFEALWKDPYNEYSVSQGNFTDYKGLSHTVDMMYSSEGKYIETDNATGFIKPYKGNYAFAAILPNSDMTLKEYVDSLTGQELHRLLNDSVSKGSVNAAMPKFSSESSVLLPDVLSQMGMVDAFDSNKANFSGINSEEQLFISNVIHKTKIEVSESGTKAAAVTAVIVGAESAEPSKTKTVTLDRPFLYMIVDCTTMKPLFVGAYAAPAE